LSIPLTSCLPTPCSLPTSLQGLRERYEAHHKLRYTDEALMAAAKYSHQYISDRFLPDKAIDLIDEAGSRVRLRHIQLPEEARDLDKELKQVTKDKDAAVRGQDFEKAGQLRDREMELKAKIQVRCELGGGEGGEGGKATVVPPQDSGLMLLCSSSQRQPHAGCNLMVCTLAAAACTCSCCCCLPSGHHRWCQGAEQGGGRECGGWRPNRH
jgi:ATP-dependent Clp protease ATP-binding subunit ClpA